MLPLQNERLAVGQEIAPPLRALESNFETAMDNAGALLSAIARGRKRAGVPFRSGVEAYERISTAVGSIVTGAKSIEALHTDLDVIRADFNISPRAFGDEGPKPATGEVTIAEPVRLVG